MTESVVGGPGVVSYAILIHFASRGCGALKRTNAGGANVFGYGQVPGAEDNPLPIVGRDHREIRFKPFPQRLRCPGGRELAGAIGI